MKNQLTTSELISNFEFKNGNPMVDLSVTDNGDTITLTLEGVDSEEFPKPYDFNEYLGNL